MAIQLRTRRQGPGFTGYIVCVIRGRRIWSESCRIVRLTRADARADAIWLRDQQLKARTCLDD